jgi:uncharacterized SAM-binding protein YcdF (DUF218 family)
MSAGDSRSVRVARGRLTSSVTVGAVALAMAAVFADAPAYWLIVEDPPERADAALVMTGDVDFQRTKAASRLVESGQARLLVLTGGEPWGGDSAQSLREVAVAHGVPPERIRMESVSENTRESLVAVAPILESEGVRSVILVTSPYHQLRAWRAARRALPGIRLINRPAPCSHWSPRGWWRQPRSRQLVLREYGKLLYYLLRGWA